ncbi:hypothetical protein HWV62_38815 [Athelia sp. TMB]|nr:hypothetical protein HWV62_38815 [Athelia sp. TMB]
MNLPPTEQLAHDRINLGRLVKRLESSIQSENWDQANGNNAWIKSQGTLQRIKHARQLLKNVEADDPDPSSPKSAQRYRDMRIALDKTEDFILAVDKRVAPKRSKPPSLLSTLPIPVNEPPTPEKPSPSTLDTLLPADESHKAPLTDDLLLSAAEASALPPMLTEHHALPSISHSALPASTSTFPASTLTQRPAAKAPTPAFAQNSAALQQELSDQLAQMASQLKRNTVHFSEALAKDAAVVEDAGIKLGSNYDVMKKERGRVRDLTGKTGGTTCLVMMSVVAVLVAFIFMVLLIRAT